MDTKYIQPFISLEMNQASGILMNFGFSVGDFNVTRITSCAQGLSSHTPRIGRHQPRRIISRLERQ